MKLVLLVKPNEDSNKTKPQTPDLQTHVCHECGHENLHHDALNQQG